MNSEILAAITVNYLMIEHHAYDVVIERKYFSLIGYF